MKKRYAPHDACLSFSQSGEDIIIKEILKRFDIKKPTYIDIGAYHPFFGNNTYLFYSRGSNGVIAEPNNHLCEIIRKKERRIYVFAKDREEKIPWVFFSRLSKTLEEKYFLGKKALEWEKTSGQKVEKIAIEIFSLNTVISNYFSNSAPDLVSIDAEGYDKEIMSGFD